MSEDVALPPTACLDRAVPSSQEGGTVIAKDVRDLAAHQMTLRDPDRVRPPSCRCGWKVLHVHDRRSRLLAAYDRGNQHIEVLVFRCAACGATWRVLPAFVARHLWRSWDTVCEAIVGAARSVVPARTVQRWTRRLKERATVLVMVLGRSGTEALVTCAEVVGPAGTRRRVVDVFGGLGRIAMLAHLVHHLEPGVRVM
jgi:hypothetical protein